MSTDSPTAGVGRALWPLRIVWLLTPFLVGPAAADGLGERSDAVASVASSLAWAGWAVVLVATLIPRSVTLTVVRVIAPGILPLGLWAAVASGDGATGALAVASALVAAGLALVGPGVADAFVDGSSYGDERRFALRVPISLLVAPVPGAWAAAAAGVVTGPLLLASERWAVGGAATVVGIVVAAVVVRRLHELSRRWLVFVPAGVVVHDSLSLAEPVLFATRALDRFGPVTDDRDAVDVTGGATGLVLELRPREPISIGRRRGRDTTEMEDVPALLVSPTQPGATLALARDRRLPVG